MAKKVLTAGTKSAGRLEILCVVPEPVAIRLDRLLANELRLSRSRIQSLEKAGDLIALPTGSSLRRAARNGMRLIVKLPASDSARPLA